MINSQKTNEAIAILRHAAAQVLAAMKTLPAKQRNDPALSLNFKAIAGHIGLLIEQLENDK